MIVSPRIITSKLLPSAELIAQRFVTLCRENKRTDAVDELYSDKITSITLRGERSEKTEGKIAVFQKLHEWNDSAELIRDLYISDPIISGDYFSCTMEIDVFLKGIGRVWLKEIGVYKVQYGKIVFEQFFFSGH